MVARTLSSPDHALLGDPGRLGNYHRLGSPRTSSGSRKKSKANARRMFYSAAPAELGGSVCSLLRVSSASGPQAGGCFFLPLRLLMLLLLRSCGVDVRPVADADIGLSLGVS